jgi:tetratricopeptide (TPR) repeat protein
MTPERFRLVEELYYAVRERTAGERAAVLAQADPELRREVESLLLSPSSGGQFLDRPAIENTPDLLDAPTIQLPPGACLGPYRIECKLGEGGMGEVFRAIDTRLGRAVAIKTTHEQFNTRFEREARAISALNHPNICTLYDIGPNYLVMELVEGETLAARLKQGPLAIDLVRTWGLQIAAALAEAHARGIVHRDLKPGNIMAGKSGIKVLDFGLAKSGEDETITGSRMVMGTPAYMAPEQREGKAADARSDIYSFGCVLYEMSTGGRSMSQRRRIPSRQLEQIVSRCLEEDPGRRWQSAAELERELGRATPSIGRRKIVLAAAVILVVLAAGYFYFHRAPRLTEKDTMILADFRNMTGDPVFDETLRQGLAVQLEQSPFLSLIPDQRVRKVLGLMGQPADARLTPQLAREICERTASAAVLDGSIARLGSQYVLGLSARDCRSGKVLDEEQAPAARKEEVLGALSQIARRFRTRIGESLATIEKHSTPLEEATTSSLDALKAYSAARKVAYTTGTSAAVPLMKRAIEIDPKFAMAHAQLGLWYGAQESALSVETATRAWELRDRASDPEKFFITANYETQVTGNLLKAQETCKLWAETYPRLKEPHGFLSGTLSQNLGKFEQSIEEGKKAIEIEPDFAPGYVNQIWSFLYLDRIEEAAKALQRAEERKLEFEDFFILHYYIAFLKGDREGMERAVAQGKGKSGVEDWVLDEEAFGLAYFGHLQQARMKSRRAVDLARQAGQPEKGAMYEAGAAVEEAFYGNTLKARQWAAAAMMISNNRDAQYGAAFALALAGDSSRSRALADDLERRFPEDTLVRFVYLPSLRASNALNQGEPQKAIDHLQAALPYDFALPGTWFGFFGMIYPAYIRGEAYLAAHQYAEAAAEFQKIIDHRGLVFNDPVGAVARWKLGQALRGLNATARAKSAYDDFFRLWKDADPDIPILRQARAEYLRLE